MFDLVGSPEDRFSHDTAHILLCFSGLGGKPRLVDIGGPPYLLPLVQRDKVRIPRGTYFFIKAYVVGAH